MDTTQRGSNGSDGWIAEKADNCLEAACKLVDWFRQRRAKYSEAEREEIVDKLFTIIYDSSKLSTFGHGNRDCWNRTWVDLMLKDGQDRLREFKMHVRRQIPDGPNPGKWPLFVQQVIESARGLLPMLEGDEDKTQVRTLVLRIAEDFSKSTLESARETGERLKDLVDAQAVHTRISWPDFISRTSSILQTISERVVEEYNRNVESWP